MLILNFSEIYYHQQQLHVRTKLSQDTCMRFVELHMNSFVNGRRAVHRFAALSAGLCNLF